VSVNAVMTEIFADEIFYDQSGGGVTFSGGEPLMQIAFLDSLLRASRERGIHTAVDTCGFAPPEDFGRILDVVNLFLYDLKTVDEKLHEKYTGSSNMIIHENLKMLSKSNIPVIVRVPLIPGMTATDGNIDAISDFLNPLPSLRRIDLLPYNKLGEDKIRRFKLNRNHQIRNEISDEDIAGFKRTLESRGFDVRIEG
jgi:pyruvate formate lyase activating enzyme